MTVTPRLTARQVGPTFAGEVSGLDFTKPFPPDLREQVENLIYQYGVLIFRNIPGMSNEKHLEFSKLFGELDSNPLVFGQKTRLENENLFDISNLAADNKTILEPTDRRFKFGKVAITRQGLTVGKCTVACGCLFQSA
jgi:alpha-ketoglutarate-dependent 2,4-dichlorophenoxyacetate dioxygenase